MRALEAMVHARGFGAVSSVVSPAVPGTERTPLSAALLLTTQRRRTVVGALGLAAGVGGFALVWTSPHLLHPEAYAIVIASIVISTTAVALYWAVRRPGNILGLLLLALAAATAGVALQGASAPLLHSIGVLFDPVAFIAAYVVIFAFPEGRVARRFEQVLLAAIAAVVLTSFLPWFFFSPVVAGGNPLAGCNASCPANALMIADRPRIAEGLGNAERYGAIVVSAAIAILIVYRLATATRPRRRASIPVYVPALLFTIPFCLFQAWGAGFIELSADGAWTLGWFLNVGRVTLPLGIVFAIVQADLAAGVVFKKMMGRLSASASASELRNLMSDALDDPSLDLAVRAGQSSSYVDPDGDPIDPTTIPGECATPVLHKGEPVAFIVHDSALAADPELLRAAGEGVLLALESGRLTRELQSSNEQIARAGEAERVRIEQDLHDGAQQHLVALRVKVELARDLADGEGQLAERLTDLGDELEDVLHELRELAHGDYPPVLRDGLEDALATAARRASQAVDLDADGVGRFSRDVEAAVYFCCVEGLQNYAKHAGPGARAQVRLWNGNGRLWFQISDDGRGFDPTEVRAGQGLTNMQRRVARLSGSLSVDSRPGGGVTVRGSVSTLHTD